jgi:hypothetical protein
VRWQGRRPELVCCTTRYRTGESADAVWRALRSQSAAMHRAHEAAQMAHTATRILPDGGESSDVVSGRLIEPLQRRWPPRPAEQLTLF